MSTNFKKYFTTGEFAKLFGVHKKTLFHYDSIGLFCPEKTLDNGYRYYSHNQIELFNVITQLKRLGMPLKDIKFFIDNRNPEMAIEFFKKEKIAIDKEIKNLQRLKKLMDTKINLTQLGIDFTDDIKIEEQEEEKLILSNYIMETEDEYDIKTYTEHLKYCFNNKLDSGYPIGMMINANKLHKNDFSHPDYYFTKVEKNYSKENIFIKPRGLYVVGYIKGYYDTNILLYERLVKFINENNLSIDGYSYEQGLIDEISVKNQNDYVSKISIKIND
ncbi:MAG: MerR family transcriptional regulator [Clostridium butyricum]|nr:MerR family transcriptional regulator [Clostridium butyricum]